MFVNNINVKIIQNFSLLCLFFLATSLSTSLQTFLELKSGISGVLLHSLLSFSPFLLIVVLHYFFKGIVQQIQPSLSSFVHFLPQEFILFQTQASHLHQEQDEMNLLTRLFFPTLIWCSFFQECKKLRSTHLFSFKVCMFRKQFFESFRR